MCEGHYDMLTDESPRGDTVFIPAEGPELDALVEKVARDIHAVTCGFDFSDGDFEAEISRREARAAIEAMRGKP